MNPLASSLTGSGAAYMMFLFKVNDDRASATLVLSDGTRTQQAPADAEFLQSLVESLDLEPVDLEQFHPDGLGKPFAVGQARTTGFSADSAHLHIQIPSDVGERRNRPYGYSADVRSAFLTGRIAHFKAHGQLPDDDGG